MTQVEEVIKIIEKNQNLKTNELIWLPEVKKYNLPTSTILVLIEEVRKNNLK
jgi:hypothetical protein